MRRIGILISFIIFISAVAIAVSLLLKKEGTQISRPKPVLLKVALVADSHNDNDLLAKALAQARGLGANFVIGLGDYTKVGTIEELATAKKVFEESGLEYFVTPGDHDLWAGREEQLRGSEGSEGKSELFGESKSKSNGSNEGSEGAKTALDNFRAVFGEPTSIFDREKVRFVILDNSDIYTGVSPKDWLTLNSVIAIRQLAEKQSSQTREEIAASSFDKLRTPRNDNLIFVFAHKAPYHPQSAHIMGETTPAVARQAKQLVELIEQSKIDGFFSGDLHFFAQFSSKGGSASGGPPGGSVRMTTIGAVTRTPNPQGPRFGVLTVYKDYSWEVEDISIQ